MDDAKITFGKRLRLARKARGMTLEALGQAAAMGFKHVGEIERGETAPSFEAMDRLASSLKIPLHELFLPFQPSPAKTDHLLRQLVKDLDAHGSPALKRMLVVVLTLAKQIDSDLSDDAKARLSEVVESRLVLVPK